MSFTDILQDVYDREQMPHVKKLRLFFVHIIGVICMGYTGQMISFILYMRNFGSINNVTYAPTFSVAEFLDEIREQNIVRHILSISAIIFGGLISYLICKKKKLSVVIPISITLYGYVLFWLLGQIPYVPMAFPGSYFLHYLGLNMGPVINIVYFLTIAWFMFFSKTVRNWWLKPKVR